MFNMRMIMKTIQKLFDAIRKSALAVQSLVVTAPTSEWSVIFLLGQLSVQGEFHFVEGSGAFPDCTLRIDGQDIKVELELASSQYVRHRHPMDGCDAIICWHNDTKIPIPTLSLSKLFPNVPTPDIAQIDYVDKTKELGSIFKHFRDWAIAHGFVPSVIPVFSETNTLTFLLGARSLCSVQFCGDRANEYVRFRFYKAALSKPELQEQIVSVFRDMSDGRSIRYSSSKMEERIDLYADAESQCTTVTDRLDTVMKQIG